MTNKREKAGITVLCPLTSVIEEKVSRGKSVGKAICYRMVIAADKYNWIIGRETLDSEGSTKTLIGEKFCQGFCHLLPIIDKHYNGCNTEVLENIVRELSERTKMPTVIIPKDATEKLGEYGKVLDTYYHTNFNKVNDDPKEGSLYKRLFR